MGGNVTVRLNLNATGYSAEMAKAQKTMQGFSSATREMGIHTVSSMQASSAAIRVLEGGMTGNIRAAERFISMIPGVGTALKAAFPLVGGIALAGVFVKIGEEAARAIQKIEGAEQAITNSFRSLNLSGLTANDTLAITNDRLENEIAKLQGKPANNLAIAIDEARLAADKMAESLDRDNTKIKELLSQNAVPWWAGFLGKAGTSVVATSVNAQNQHLADLANQANVLQHQGDTAGADRARAEIERTRQEYLQQNAKDIADRRSNQSLAGGLNQGANVSIELGQQASLYNQIDQQSELKRNVADEALKQKLEDQKAQEEAAKKALAAMKQAQEAIVAQWRKDLEELKADNDMTLAQEAQFWVRRMEGAKRGSLSYLAALSEVNKDIARMRGENMRGQAQFDATSAGAYLPGAMDLSKGESSTMQGQGRAAAEYLKTLNEGISQHQANAVAIAEESLQMEVMTGRMSRLDAAQALATLHAQEYKDAVDQLDQALANAKALPPGFARDQAIAGLNNQGAQMDAQRQMQVGRDQQAISSQQLGPAMQDALRVMTTEWSNMTREIVDTMGRAIDGFNENITKAATGHGKASDFGHTFLQAGEGLFKTGLQKGESMLFGGLFGKGKGTPGSSPANRTYVSAVIEGGTATGGTGSGGAGSSATGLLGKLIPGIAPFIQPFQGFFASGGDVLANHPAMVGERGPEMFVPHTSGRIVPNHQIGGGGDTHIHVDARGSNDPAAIHAAVARALPHAVVASMHAMHSAAKRSPHGR